MSQGKNVKAFKQKVRENSNKFSKGTRKPSTKLPIVTKTGDTDDKLMKPGVKKSSANRARKSGTKVPSGTYTPSAERTVTKFDKNKSTNKPRYEKKPAYNNKPAAPEKKPVRNVFFPSNVKSDPTDKHITESKSSQVAMDLLNPYYTAINTHIINAIDAAKAKCEGRTSFKVNSNRSKWNKCHAITFDIKFISTTGNKKTRDLLLYFVKNNEKDITIIIANSMADSSAIVYHYSGLAVACSVGTYLPKIIESTERLFSEVKTDNKSEEVIAETKKD